MARGQLSPMVSPQCYFQQIWCIWYDRVIHVLSEHLQNVQMLFLASTPVVVSIRITWKACWKQTARPHPQSFRFCGRFCTSNNSSGDANIAGPGTTLWELLVWTQCCAWIPTDSFLLVVSSISAETSPLPLKLSTGPGHQSRTHQEDEEGVESNCKIL